MADRRATSAELAAMRLALGVLRESALCWGRIPDARANSGISAAAEAIGLARMPRLSGAIGVARDRNRGSRLLRARLALYLRARLRMERGDLGPVECHACGAAPTRWRGPGDRCERCWDATRAPYDGTYRVRTRITPLWQLAPAHEARR